MERIGKFQKGNVPWNKNKKGIHLSPGSEFKKGLAPKNKVSVGSITIRTRHGKQRRWIKIDEPNVWIKYARFAWIKANGKIPKGYIIHHIDGDSLNDSIDNLALVTRKAHFEIHKIGKKGRAARKRKIGLDK